MFLKCTKCNLEKDESEFTVSRLLVHRNYKSCLCIKCQSEWKPYNKESQKRKYQKRSTPEYIKTRKERQKEYHLKNREHRLEMQKQWYAKNRETQAIRMREYRKEYEKRPDVRPVKRIRDLFNKWLKYTGGAKHSSVLKLIGMEKELFRGYIEDQFTDGMTWDSIHIDHYVPLSYFDPHSEEDRLIAWNYRNLRPMFASDNMSKNDTVPADAEEHIEMIKKHLAVSQE